MKQIKCPKCGERDWSSDYWYCPTCNYYVGKEETLLEMNKDYLEGKGRGDEPVLDLYAWKEGQIKLTEEMIDVCLPKNSNNYEVYCNEVLPLDEWGGTAYHEPVMKERIDFIIRNADSLTERGDYGRHWKWHQYPNGLMVKLPLYPYINNSRKTEIYINKDKMTEEGFYLQMF